MRIDRFISLSIIANVLMAACTDAKVGQSAFVPPPYDTFIAASTEETSPKAVLNGVSFQWNDGTDEQIDVWTSEGFRTFYKTETTSGSRQAVFAGLLSGADKTLSGHQYTGPFTMIRIFSEPETLATFDITSTGVAEVEGVSVWKGNLCVGVLSKGFNGEANPRANVFVSPIGKSGEKMALTDLGNCGNITITHYMKKNYLPPELTVCEMEFRSGLMAVSAPNVDAIEPEGMEFVDIGISFPLDV